MFGLSKNEALILFEMLSRRRELFARFVEDKSEQIVLERLCCALESNLPKPSQAGYHDILKHAKQEVIDASPEAAQNPTAE